MSFSQIQANQYQPYKVLIYYGTPQGVNHVWDDDLAAQIFAEYDYIVFGAGLEDPNSPFYLSTKNIISNIHSINPNAIVFGYIDLGVTTNNFSLYDIENMTDQWELISADGIFLDDAGYDFGVSRDRLNSTLDYIHSKNMFTTVNAWNADDVMSDQVDLTYNPFGIPTHMGIQDFYLLESFFVNTDAYASNEGYASNTDYKMRGDSAVYYRNTLGVKMLATNIVDYSMYSNANIRKFFKMSETAAAIFSLDGYGLSPLEYSASGPSINVVRPMDYAIDYMSYYTTNVSYQVSRNFMKFTRGNIILYSKLGNHWYRMP
ncbi:hypothetical protein [Ectobacillus panaciterrae]|uniref:hypothetical protein n=1 Tax=Ectobacillus panaciterrae TaxID=363872 RepID=UPI000421D249|nr:hypothetical protein [Ectobacillus panaciterrae]